MHELDLILTLAGGLAAALVCGYITFRIGLSPIVGYLVAGFIVGDNTPGFTANKEFAGQFAEVGVILLMFGVGLQFHLNELLAVQRVAVPGALGRCLLITLLGTLVGWMFGWGMTGGALFGLAISVASTVVLLRVLADHNDLHTPTGHIAVGWLVVEDLFTVLVLVLIPAIFAQDQGAGAVGTAVFLSILKLVAMIALTLVGGGRLVPWILDRVAATRSRELFTLTVLTLALGIAVGSARIFGVSMALGAFLAGMVVGRSEFSLRAAIEALPMRDAFAVLFFVSVGMLFSPRHLIEHPIQVSVTLAIVLIAKPLFALVIVRLLRYPLATAVSLGLITAQIGEFSFILASAGKNLGILNDEAINSIIAAAIISISINPILYRLAYPIEQLLRKHVFTTRSLGDSQTNLATAGDAAEAGARHKAIVIGSGPVGRTVTRLLRETQIQPMIIELNMETVRSLHQDGIQAIYGDATHAETLREAGIEKAVVLILSASTMQNAEETIRRARELNKRIRIFARANHLRETPALHAAGADIVFSGEGEVALSMTEFLLRQLGATAEQIDRERVRIRTELFKGPAKVDPLQERRNWLDPESVVIEPAQARDGQDAEQRV